MGERDENCVRFAMNMKFYDFVLPSTSEWWVRDMNEPRSLSSAFDESKGGKHTLGKWMKMRNMKDAHPVDTNTANFISAEMDGHEWEPTVRCSNGKMS